MFSQLFGRSKDGEPVDNRNAIFGVLIGASVLIVISAAGLDAVLATGVDFLKILGFAYLAGVTMGSFVSLVVFRKISGNPENDVQGAGVITFALSAVLLTFGIWAVVAFNSWFVR